MSKLKELREKRARAFADVDAMRQKFDGKEISAEERAAWDKAISDVEKIDGDIASEERYLAIQAGKAQITENSREKENKADAEMRAFAKFLMNANLSAEEQALLRSEKRDSITGMASTYLVPSAISNFIEVAMANGSGLIGAATKLNTTDGGDLTIPTINDTTSKATIVAPYTQSSKGTKTFSSIQLKAYTYRTPIIPISYELLQDSQFDLVTFLGNLLYENFERGLNDSFTNGTGTSQPKGIVTAANTTTLTSATAITVEDILDLMSKVATPYQAKSKFMMNFSTQVALMKLKDGNGSYIWSPGTSGIAPTIFGHEIVLNSEVASIAKNNVPVVYGDLSKYMIRNVKSVSIQVLREALAEYLSVGVMGYCRADGALIDAGTKPVAALKMAAS